VAQNWPTKLSLSPTTGTTIVQATPVHPPYPQPPSARPENNTQHRRTSHTTRGYRKRSEPAPTHARKHTHRSAFSVQARIRLLQRAAPRFPVEVFGVVLGSPDEDGCSVLLQCHLRHNDQQLVLQIARNERPVRAADHFAVLGFDMRVVEIPNSTAQKPVRKAPNDTNTTEWSYRCSRLQENIGRQFWTAKPLKTAQIRTETRCKCE
jgi:hypothetical protein